MVFTLKRNDGFCSARTATLSLAAGEVPTPVFMPVGTGGTVKALTAGDLEEIGFNLILSNAYHLALRPGVEVIEKAGGLARFMNWPGGILTDSGGFQVFSLSHLRKITEEGASFRSHIDGSLWFFSPESVAALQCAFGSDIQMPLDYCSKWGASRKEAEAALSITNGWLLRAKKTWQEKRDSAGYGGSLFSIVQGNFFPDLRRRACDFCIEADTPGLAIGGLSVGEPGGVFADTLAATAQALPEDKPRYAMGLGTPAYILSAIEHGIDMFDCVLPTREARNGRVYTRRGHFSLKKSDSAFDFSPIDEKCACKVCRSYSRAYMRHLFKSREILFSMLASYHNLYFLHDLVARARAAIEKNMFLQFKKEFLAEYESGGEGPA